MFVRRFLFASLAAATLFAAGCGGGGGGSSSGGNSNRPTYEVLNASPDSTGLDFRINDDQVATSLPYGSSSGAFNSLKPDLYDVNVHPTGAAQDAWSEAFNFTDGNDTAVVAFGLQTFGDEYYKRLRLAFVPVDRNAPNGTKARLFVLNAFNRAPGFENVSLDFKNPGDNPQYDIEGISFGASSEVEVDAGSQSFDMRVNGAEQVIVSKTLQLGAGKIYLVLLTGVEDATGTKAPDMKLIELPAR